MPLHNLALVHAPDELNPGEKYALVWSSFLEALQHFRDAVSATEAIEVSLFGKQDYPALEASRLLREIDPSEIAGRIVSLLVKQAEEAFSPPHGTRLRIDTRAYSDQFLDPIRDLRGDQQHWPSFDPAALWSALVDEFGGDRGHEAAYRDLARQLADAFGLRPGSPLEHKKGFVVLNQRIYLNPYSNKIAQLEHHSHNDFQKLCHNLAGFVRWAIDDDEEDGRGWRIAMTLQQLARDWGYHDPIESRKLFSFGDGAIQLVTYQTRFEWRLSPALAGKLQVLLSMYPPA